MKQTVKDLLLVVGFFAVGFLAFMMMFTFIFGGYLFPYFLPTILVVGYLGIWVQIAYGKSIRNTLGIIILSFIAYSSYVFYIEYQRNISTVKEFSMYDYEPFRRFSKTAKLEEASSLKLSQNLPRLDGSTALYPMYAAFVQATYDQEKYTDNESVLKLSKTGQAYERLLKGEVDVIFVPTPSKAHLAKAREQGVAFKLTPIAKEAFVFFVNSKNEKVNNLTVEQIQGIYSGKIKNWREVGGKNDDIRAFQRPENSGSQTALQKLMGDIPLIEAPREDVPSGMGEIINQVANYRNFSNALGFSFLLYSTELVQAKEIKLLNINGIAPNQDNIRANTYPFTYDIFAVTLGNESKETKQLIEWIQSPQGKSLIEKTGYVAK